MKLRIIASALLIVLLASAANYTDAAPWRGGYRGGWFPHPRVFVPRVYLPPVPVPPVVIGGGYYGPAYGRGYYGHGYYGGGHYRHGYGGGHRR